MSLSGQSQTAAERASQLGEEIKNKIKYKTCLFFFFLSFFAVNEHWNNNIRFLIFLPSESFLPPIFFLAFFSFSSFSEFLFSYSCASLNCLELVSLSLSLFLSLLLLSLFLLLRRLRLVNLSLLFH